MPDFVSRTPIEKGWSNDKKFCAVTAEGERYLIRISPAEKAERSRRAFEMMEQVAALGVPMSRPVDFSILSTGEAQTICTWVAGSDAEQILPTLPTAEQYAYGIAAGQYLKIIHSIPVPAEQEEWEQRFNRKLDRKIKLYGECPIKYPGGEALLAFIAENRHLLAGRPQCYQHGDYHVGNLMLGVDQQLYVIDFDRDDFGDPWEEFNRISWCAQKAPAFAAGRVDGYFDGAVPEKFWRLLALYIASNTLSSLPWAIPFGQGEIDTMLKQGRDVLAWYDNMRDPVPTWYTKAKK